MKKRMRLWLSFLSVVICVELAVLILQKPSLIKGDISLAKYADIILSKCSKESYHPACYDKEIPKLMDSISFEDAFKVTRIVQEKDPTYQYCHVLAHNLSAREVAKDPSKWKELVSRCPSGMCSNGCIHGGFQERFRAESLTDKQIIEIKPDLKNLCEDRDNWHPTGLEQASCYHAIGHLTMYMTSANIDKSIALCKEVAIKNDRRDFGQLCFDGVFMQIFQPLEPEDFALVKGKVPTKENVEAFCSKYTGQMKGSCLSESWPLFRDELQKPEGLVAFCSKSEASEQNRCYSAIIYVLTPQFNFDLQKIEAYCSGLPENISKICFANAASRMIETDYRNANKAASLCSNAISASQNACFEELLKYSDYNFHAGSEEFLKFCNALPNTWKDKCLKVN